MIRDAKQENADRGLSESALTKCADEDDAKPNSLLDPVQDMAQHTRM
jgi:hypothetical protein